MFEDVAKSIFKPTQEVVVPPTTEMLMDIAEEENELGRNATVLPVGLPLDVEDDRPITDEELAEMIGTEPKDGEVNCRGCSGSRIQGAPVSMSQVLMPEEREMVIDVLIQDRYGYNTDIDNAVFNSMLIGHMSKFVDYVKHETIFTFVSAFDTDVNAVVKYADRNWYVVKGI